MKSRITELFNIEYPLIQGGMRYVAQAELVAAVANAGALGFLSAHSFATPELLAAEIEKTRSFTNKPFGVNLTLLSKLSVKPEVSAQVILDANIPVVETAGGNPGAFIELFKAKGIKVLHKCTSVRFALKAQQLGADAVSLTGFEAAGHTGEENVPNTILIPSAASQLEIPIVANGGFADGRGLVAALALGAEGISMGTRFLVTQESPMAQRVKARYLEANERDTTLICQSVGDSTRVLKNALTDEIHSLEKAGITHEELMTLASGQRWVEAAMRDDPNDGAYAAGMGVGLIQDIPTCQELVQSIVSQARKIIGLRLSSMM